MTFLSHDSGYYRLPVNRNAALYPATKTAGFWGKEKYLIGRVSSKWLTFAPTYYGKVPRETRYRVEDLEHYGNRIPWAGSIILRIGQQAKAHPHVTRVLTVLKPRL